MLAVLALLGLAACGGPDSAASAQRISVCVGPSSSRPAGTQVDIELRQSARTVAKGRITVGGILTVEVPPGRTRVFLDGSSTGETGVVRSSGTQPAQSYVSSPGCPATPPSPDSGR